MATTAEMVRYYGYYSNVSRGKRKKQNLDELIPSVLESDESSKERRKNWARLIQKIYEVDPLTCPKCSGKMKVISVIEDEDIIIKILKHLGLWDRKARPPPKATCLRLPVAAATQTGALTHRQAGPPKTPEYSIDYSVSQLPASDNLSRASRSNERLYVDPEYPEACPP